ncbi:MAG TPA: DUF1232 domain-containing protein [Thermoanaerobaculia bacterium]|nr:DUF1232 domain-containing protein [Thermoanaerobaculia bacterium]
MEGPESVASEERSDAALETRELPSGGLLSFYDRLRGRILATVRRRGGKLGAGAAEALLLVPDVFILLVRLALDSEVPKPARALIVGALAYFILPFDLLPEGVVGPLGYMDDLVIACAVLTQALGGDLEPFARKYWSGSESLRVVLHDVTRSAQALLGENLFLKVEKALARRGVKIS